MIRRKKLREQIHSLYPEVGECGVDIDLVYDRNRQTWIVELKKGELRLRTTTLGPQEACACMEGRYCGSLGLQISQLLWNLQQS